MTKELPKNHPKNAAELMEKGGHYDEFYITARVREQNDRTTLSIDSDCPIYTTVKGWDEANGGLKGVMSRADAIKNLKNDIRQVSGNAIVYIKMPDHSVKIWTTERDGPPVWAGYSTGAGGMVGAEGPAITSVKEMSEEVGIVIRTGHLSLLSLNDIEGCIGNEAKAKQRQTVQEKLAKQGIDESLSIYPITVRKLISPCHTQICFYHDGELKQRFKAHVFAEADHFDKPENIGNTVSFQRYFMIDLSNMRLTNDDIIFVNPDPFDSPAVPVTFEELERKHVTSDGRIIRAFPPIASILHPDNRIWAHPDQMLRNTI